MVCFEAEGEEKQETKGNSNGNVIKTCRAGANDAFLSASLGGISSHYGGKQAQVLRNSSCSLGAPTSRANTPERNGGKRKGTWRNVEERRGTSRGRRLEDAHSYEAQDTCSRGWF